MNELNFEVMTTYKQITDKIILAGKTQLLEEDVKSLIENKQYIVNYGAIYAPHYSANVGYYFTKIYTKPKTEKLGYTLRGRFHRQTASQVNRLVGFNLLREDIY